LTFDLLFLSPQGVWERGDFAPLGTWEIIASTSGDQEISENIDLAFTPAMEMDVMAIHPNLAIPAQIASKLYYSPQVFFPSRLLHIYLEIPFLSLYFM
jgi:hypothetical protein